MARAAARRLGKHLQAASEGLAAGFRASEPTGARAGQRSLTGMITTGLEAGSGTRSVSALARSRSAMSRSMLRPLAGRTPLLLARVFAASRLVGFYGLLDDGT